mgnify:CR=1 FL=1
MDEAFLLSFRWWCDNQWRRSALQSDFVRDILKECRDEGINTAIESSLYGPYEALEKMLPYLNTVLWISNWPMKQQHLKIYRCIQ